MPAVPFEATPIGAYPSQQAWDAQATDLVATMLRRWNLTARAAFVGGEAGAVLPVTTAGGEQAVLKVAFPHVEGIWEAVGLEAWGAPLAPAVLRQDPWTWSVLIELVEPGIPLSRHPVPAVEAVAIGARLYRELAARPAPRHLPTLDETMRPLLEKATASTTEVAEGLRVFTELLDTRRDDSLLHGDYNPGNVLLGAGRWVVIDPKPMRGDTAFDLWPLVSQLGAVWSDPHPDRLLSEHLEIACAITGVDRARASGWGFARSALSSCWLRAEGNLAAAATAERETAVWATLSS